jgi:hypothetical protein
MIVFAVLFAVLAAAICYLFLRLRHVEKLLMKTTDLACLLEKATRSIR